MEWLSTHWETLFKLLGAAGGFFLFLRGLHEYQRNTRTRRAEFLDKLINGFGDPGILPALRILDGFYLYRSTGYEDLKVTDGEKGTLIGILRNHNDPDSKIEDPREIKIREAFCAMLDFFTRLNYYLENNLISTAELQYFRYYVAKAMASPAEKKYIEYYYIYDYDFAKLFSKVREIGEANKIPVGS